MNRNSIGMIALYTVLIILAVTLVIGSTALIFHMIGVGIPDNTESDSDSEAPPGNTADDTQTGTFDSDTSETVEDTDTDTFAPVDTSSDTETSVDGDVTITIYNTPQTMYALYNVNARMSYTTESDIYGLVYQGESVSVTGETDNGWYRIDWRGYVAFVRNDLLTSDSSAANVTIEEYDSSVTMYANANVNVRESHSTNSNKLTTIEIGTEVTVTGKSANGWYRIEYNDGSAYIKEEYLSIEKPAETAPNE